MKGNEETAGPITQDDIDSLLNNLATKNKSLPAQDSARIVLEEDDENGKADSDFLGFETIEPKKRWYILKLKWICASIALVFSAGVLSYFIFVGLNQNNLMRPKIYRFPILRPSSQAIDTLPNTKKSPASVSMKDFMVLTPQMREDLTYLAADISIALKDRSDLIKIKKNEVYARSLIYNVFKQALASDIKKNIEKPQLEEAIKTALDDMVQKQFIKKVVLRKFRLI